MNGKRAKLLRKQAGYIKTITNEISKSYNITIGTGKSTMEYNVDHYEPKAPPKEEVEAKAQYKELKKQYRK